MWYLSILCGHRVLYKALRPVRATFSGVQYEKTWILTA